MQQKIPNELEETRQKVRNAYEWILGRQADAPGLAHYTQAIHSGTMRFRDLRRFLLESEEFKKSHQRKLAIVEIGNGMKVVVDPEEPEFGRFIAADGGWEPHIAETIRGLLQPGHTFVDIGANVGVMSFHAAGAVGKEGRIIAFEPNVANASAFKRGILANALDNVRLFPFGLSDQAEMIALTNASNAKVIGRATALQALEVVQAIAGDEILLPQDRIDLIKIDVEGFEHKVLAGLVATICKFQPKILLEFNPLCLRAQGRIKPAILAERLFEIAPFGDLVEHNGSHTRVHSATELMDLWTQRDAEATKERRLPAGWVHFDILLDPAR